MKAFIDIPKELILFIQSGSKFIIAGHREPDGDCIGSQLALCSILTRMGKEATACSAGPFKRAETASYANQFKAIPDDRDKANARLILVDCSEHERTGDLEPHIRGLPTAVIDHHATAITFPATEKLPYYIDPAAPSVTLMIFSLADSLGIELTKKEAELLLLGLCTDTGFFRHIEKNSAEIFRKTAELLKTEVSLKKIYHAIYGGKSINSRIMLGRVLSRAKMFFNKRLIITYEKYEDIKELGIESRDSEALYQQLQSVTGAEVIAFIRQENENHCSVGLRSHDEIDVGFIAGELGGGGHKHASGFNMDGDITLVQNLILEKFRKLL